MCVGALDFWFYLIPSDELKRTCNHLHNIRGFFFNSSLSPYPVDIQVPVDASVGALVGASVNVCVNVCVGLGLQVAPPGLGVHWPLFPHTTVITPSGTNPGSHWNTTTEPSVVLV